jgi:putative DNA primase/helicase
MNAVAQAIEFPKDAARRLAAGALRDGYKAQALHEYRDADGTPLLWRIRCKHTDTGDKWIRPMHWNGASYAIGEPPGPAAGKPLYRLPELLAADPAALVLIVEGEWCADHLHRMSLISTTSGSAASTSGTDWTPLRGRHCLIWGDHDAPGSKYADEVAEILHGMGCTVELIDVAALNLPKKGDAVDWLALHPNGTARDVFALPRLTPDFSGVAGVAGVARCAPTPAAPHPATPSGEGVAKAAPRARFDVVVNQAKRRPGVYWIGTARDKDSDEEVEKEPEWICSPMVVAATTRNSDGSEWGRHLVFTDRDGLEHRWAMPQTMMATDGAELRIELLRQGLEIATDGTRRRRLLDYIQGANPDTAARCVTRTGWHDDAFVLPDLTYNDEAEPVIYQAASLDGIALSQAGTLKGWRDHVALPCAGNNRLVLSIAAGFAGPCLGLANAEGGGIHLRGSSSVGKSTALQVAASIFGQPARFVRTWRQTDNALEGVASLHSDLLLILDEIKELAAKDAGAVAYMLGNGQGKGRANRSGAARAAARWRLLFLSSGEVGLGDLIAQSGGTLHAGHEVRFIDVPADAGAGLGLFDCVPGGIAPGVFADQLKAAAATHYGHALPVFLERLTGDVTGNRDLLASMRDALADDLASGTDDGQVRRVAQRFALIAAAGALATNYGLTGWQVEESERAARACFRDWLAARGTKGNSEPATMLAAVRAFLGLHGESRFTPWDADERTPRTINRAGFRKNTAEGPEYYVEGEAFRGEITKGFDARAVARLLIEHDCLLAGPDGKATRSERLPDGRNTRVYRITPKLWEIEL